MELRYKLKNIFKLKLLCISLNSNRKFIKIFLNLKLFFNINYIYNYLFNSNLFFNTWTYKFNSLIKVNNNINIFNYLFYKNFFNLKFYNLFFRNININLNKVSSNYNFLSFLYFYKNCITKTNKSLSLQSLNNFNNLFYFKYFILNFIDSFLNNKKLYISFKKNSVLINEVDFIYNILLKKVKFLTYLKEINFKNKLLLNMVIYVLISKDVTLFKNTIKYILENLHFKKHRRFLYSIKVLFKFLSLYLFRKFNCLGVVLKIKGKIGVGGNLKKRKFILKTGSFSFTKKSQKIQYIKDSIRTYSGVLGFEFFIAFK